MNDGLTIEGFCRVDTFAMPARTQNEREYRTPRGGSLIVPWWAPTFCADNGVTFGGKARYSLRDCRYVRPLARKVGESFYKNLITNEGIEAMAKMLIDSSAAYDTGIKRAEIGNPASAIVPTVDDTALVNYHSRWATDAPTQSAGVITVVVPITAAGAGVYIRELGIYVADNTATENAGDLLNHLAMDEDNASSPADKDLSHTFPLARKSGA